LNIYNGVLNLRNGSLLLDGADVNGILVGNQYQLSVQADTLANTENKVQNHAVSIQETVDVGVVNTNQIVSIQSNYAPLDQPIFSTNMTLPPIVISNGQYLTDVQLSYLGNVNSDIQTSLNTINSSITTSLPASPNSFFTKIVPILNPLETLDVLDCNDKRKELKLVFVKVLLEVDINLQRTLQVSFFVSLKTLLQLIFQV
jgi:hypothetical protein